MKTGELVMEEKKRMSKFFDECFERGLFRDFEEWEKRRAQKLIELFDVKPDWRILEPGCGCGRMSRLLAERLGPRGRLYACELSRRMTEYCKSADFPENVIFHNRCVLDLEGLDGSLDAVICFNVWPHFSRREPYFEKFRRLLKPGGALFIAHSCGREDINEIHRRASSELISGHMLPPASRLAGNCREAGFVVERTLDGEELYLVKGVKKGGA